MNSIPAACRSFRDSGVPVRRNTYLPSVRKSLLHVGRHCLDTPDTFQVSHPAPGLMQLVLRLRNYSLCPLSLSPGTVYCAS